MSFQVGDKVILKEDPMQRGWVETVKSVMNSYQEMIITDKHPGFLSAAKFKYYEN